MSDFEIDESNDGGVAVLGPKGSLNTRTSPTLEQRLGALLNAKSRLIVVDMKDVDYLSSSALRVLLMTTRRLKRVSGRLFLCGLREEVRKVFAISGFDRDFNIQATRKEAIALATATALPPLEETKGKTANKKPATAAETPGNASAVPAPKAVAKQTPSVTIPEPTPAPSRPPEAAPHPAAMLALKLLSKDEDVPPWPKWTGAKAPERWRDRVLDALAK